MSDAHVADIDKRVRQFFVIGASLLVLTGLTVAVAYFDFPVTIAIIVALVIATFKASLVAAVFMHLIDERQLIYAVLVVTVVFFFFLLLLPIFTDMDGLGP